MHHRQPGWRELEGLQDLEETVQQSEEDGDCERQKDDDSDDEDIVLRSRRQQQRVDVCTQLDGDCGEAEPPGAPAKKKGRILPWTEEGRRLWPGDGAGGRCGIVDEAVLVPDSQAEESGDSDTEEGEDGCSSFVVDDDSESVVGEIEASERFLTREALREVRTLLTYKMERLKRQTAKVEEQLRRLDESDELDELDDYEDECVFHGWAEHSVEGVCTVCYKG